MVCLETSFIIDVIRGEEQVSEIEKQLDKGSEAITVAAPTVMELVKGAELSNKPKSEKEKVHNFLSSLIILNLDKESAMLAGEIEAELRKKGEIIQIEDIMIGAIAKHNSETLITRNKKHFERITNLEIETY